MVRFEENCTKVSTTATRAAQCDVEKVAHM